LVVRSREKVELGKIQSSYNILDSMLNLHKESFKTVHIRYSSSMDESSDKALIVFIVPFFNEAKRFDREYWLRVSQLPFVRFYLINDGSTDHTHSFLTDIEQQSNNVKVLSCSINVGKAEAIRFGMSQAIHDFPMARYIGYRDGDSSLSWSDVAKLEGIVRSSQYDVVLGARVKMLGRNIERKWFRHYIGRVMATFLSVGLSDFPYDSQNGIKLFRNCQQLKEVLSKPFQTRWFVDLEILTGLRQSGLKYFWEEPLNSWIDESNSHVSFKSIPRIIRDIIIIKRILKQWT